MLQHLLIAEPSVRSFVIRGSFISHDYCNCNTSNTRCWVSAIATGICADVAAYRFLSEEVTVAIVIVSGISFSIVIPPNLIKKRFSIQ